MASVLDGVPFGQSALSLAAQLQRRAERAGFAFDGSHPADASGSSGSSGVTAAPLATLDSERLEDELMSLVTRAREAGPDPELSLRETARRFADQVGEWERTRA